MTFDMLLGMQFQGNTASIEIAPHHCNPTGNINGGVIISLADNLATGVAGQAWLDKTGERRFLVGVDLHAVMMANQQGGTIRAVATVRRAGRRITVVRTEVFGEGDRLLAEVTTTHVPT